MDWEHSSRQAIHFIYTKWRILLLISSGFLFVLFNMWILGTEGSHSTYKVILDAGSTGTRVHVFQFNSPKFSLRTTEITESDLALISIPLFARVHGGLSDYANNPKDCRQGLMDLLNKAKAAVPKSEWAKTEVVLMATAGLRLLHAQQADALLAEARDVLVKHSPFIVGTVDTIDGKTEAKLIYVMTHFVAAASEKQMAIVDLGGGSVQLAYKVREFDSAKEEVEEYLEKTRGSTLYLNSWLGYGLVAFRMKALEMAGDGQPHPCVPEWTPAGVTYTYGEKSMSVMPRNTGSASSAVDSCLALVRSALRESNPDSKCRSITASLSQTAASQCGLNGTWLGPSEPNSIDEWRLFSYIFDLAAEEGLVPEGESEATLSASDFLKAARVHCERSEKVHERIEWWKCVDLVYVSALLVDGFRLEPQFPLRVTKRLVYKGQIELEAAWPLGAAIAAFQNEL